MKLLDLETWTVTVQCTTNWIDCQQKQNEILSVTSWSEKQKQKPKKIWKKFLYGNDIRKYSTWGFSQVEVKNKEDVEETTYQSLLHLIPEVFLIVNVFYIFTFLPGIKNREKKKTIGGVGWWGVTFNLLFHHLGFYVNMLICHRVEIPKISLKSLFQNCLFSVHFCRPYEAILCCCHVICFMKDCRWQEWGIKHTSILQRDSQWI